MTDEGRLDRAGVGRLARDRAARSDSIGSVPKLPRTIASIDQFVDKARSRGPSTVRWMLTEAAWQGVRRSPAIRAFYERVRREDPERRKIALTATAHYLLRAMMAMLRTGEVWRVQEEAAA